MGRTEGWSYACTVCPVRQPPTLAKRAISAHQHIGTSRTKRKIRTDVLEPVTTTAPIVLSAASEGYSLAFTTSKTSNDTFSPRTAGSGLVARLLESQTLNISASVTCQCSYCLVFVGFAGMR